jgi:hypothetical protein
MADPCPPPASALRFPPWTLPLSIAVNNGDGLCHQPRAPLPPRIIPVALIVRALPPFTPFDMSIATTDAAAIEVEGFADLAVPVTRSDAEHAANSEASSDRTATNWMCLEFFMGGPR